MGWDDLGINDMNDIPDRYLCSWKFFNAFFEAFQERADYVEDVPRAITYDDLIMTGGQIGVLELQSRLSTFNNNVRGFFNNNIWYKESTWTELKSMTHVVTASKSRNKSFPGLDALTLTEWDEDALRELLTDDVYELIFENNSTDRNFRPVYWSGIYKLLNEVFLYRGLSVSEVYTPEPTEPILYLNGQETFSGSDENLSTVILDSILNSVIIQNGNKTIANSNVIFNSSYFKNSSGDEDISQLGSVIYNGITTDPFCKTPALMDIQILLWRDRGSGGEESEGSGTGDENTATPTNSSQVQEKNDPVFSSITNKTINGEVQDTTYIPNQENVFLRYAQNPHFTSTFDEESGFTNVSLASIPDLRVSNSVSTSIAVTGEADGPFNPFGSGTGSSESTGEYFLNMALCALPQSEFEFPAE